MYITQEHGVFSSNRLIYCSVFFKGKSIEGLVNSKYIGVQSPFLASLHFSQTEMSSNCSSSCGLKHVQFVFLNTCQRIGQFTKTSCHLLANPPKRSNSSLIKWTPKNKAWLGEPENGPPGREKVPFRNQKFQVSAGSFYGGAEVSGLRSRTT